MTDEELIALEREGAAIAKKATEAFRAVARLVGMNNLPAITAIMTGYLRFMFEEYPDQDRDDTVVLLCLQFAPQYPDLAGLILDRLDSIETSKGDPPCPMN